MSDVLILSTIFYYYLALNESINCIYFTATVNVVILRRHFETYTFELHFAMIKNDNTAKVMT